MKKLVDPEFFDRRIADHDRERCCVRQRSQDVFNDRVEVNRNRDHRVVGGERRVFYRSRVQGGKNHGR